MTFVVAMFIVSGVVCTLVGWSLAGVYLFGVAAACALGYWLAVGERPWGDR